LLEAGQVVSLEGDLGAGKTCLAGGIAAGVGVDPSLPVTSPSYTLVNVYEGRIPFYHVDLYRLSDSAAAIQLGLWEYLGGDGVAAVEWLDRFPSLWPDDLLRVRIEGMGGEPRILTFEAVGVWQIDLEENLALAAPSK
jgi:tRNA threonylcarbamoyladenosine biosynthesis protein TsaE